MTRLPTDDLRIVTAHPLISPAVLIDELPLDEDGTNTVTTHRRNTESILSGTDDRLMVLVGPCSIHDTAAALDYATRLRALAAKFEKDLFIVMRVYFEKPRTVVGWKGLINDPDLDGTFRINKGLRMARSLMLDVTALGLPIATEFLDTTLGQFYADLVSWGGIGARTVESQIHRELSSGLSMPVGFKNRTDGDIQVAIDAIRSALHPHWFPSISKEGAPAILGTRGNPFGHLVLRGGSRSGPNFNREAVAEAVAKLEAAKLPPRLVIDCSHANSGKDPSRQPAVATTIADQIASGEKAIAGVMLESFLVGGAQDYKARPFVYGQSITDACLSLDETIPVLRTLAEAVRSRRAKA